MSRVQLRHVYKFQLDALVLMLAVDTRIMFSDGVIRVGSTMLRGGVTQRFYKEEQPHYIVTCVDAVERVYAEHEMQLVETNRLRTSR